MANNDAPLASAFPRGAPEERMADASRWRQHVADALTLVGHALNQARRPIVAVSGGKDSLATMALVLRLHPTCPLVWSDDELEYPETVAYMTLLRELAGDQLTVVCGHATHAGWFRAWSRSPAWRVPLPGSVTIPGLADDWLARQGYDCVFLGTRGSESRQRRAHFARRGLLYQVRRGVPWRCSPIAAWTEDDVWGLIARWRLPYNAAYDRLRACGIARERQRVGPLPLVPRAMLLAGWPDLLDRLEARYGIRWR